MFMCHSRKMYKLLSCFPAQWTGSMASRSCSLCRCCCCCDKIPYVKPFKEEGFMLAHSLRLGSVMVGKARQQEHKATSHIASTVTKQREVNDGALVLLSLDFSLGPEPKGCCHPSLLWIFIPRLTKSTNSHTEVPRGSLPRRFTILSRWQPYKPLES